MNKFQTIEIFIHIFSRKRQTNNVSQQNEKVPFLVKNVHHSNKRKNGVIMNYFVYKKSSYEYISEEIF